MKNTISISPSVFSIWVAAARPKTLIASVSPVCIGTALAHTFDFYLFLSILLFAVCIQVGTNFANDYFDFFKGADTAERKGPPRVMQKGWVTPSAMKKGIIIVFAFALLFSLVPISRVGIGFLFIPIVAIGLGVLYTAGPYSLAYMGLGEIFVLVFFGLVATWGSYYAQTLEWSMKPIIAGLGPGLLSCAILVVNNVRDVEEDRKAGKKTLVVRFGKTFGEIEYVICISGALLILASVNAVFAMVLLLGVYPLLKNITEALPKTAQFLMVYTALFCWGVLL